MLHKYIELLRNGLEAITSLSIHDATFLDYLTAVGYEFAIILLGLLILVIGVGILVTPYLLMAKANKYLRKKIDEKEDERYLWLKVSWVKHAVGSDFSYDFDRHWKEIERALSKNLNKEGFAELLEVMKSTVSKTEEGCTFINRGPAMPKIALLNEKYKISEKAENMAAKLETQTKLLKCALWVSNITAYVIMAIFVIPLVLMFF